MPHSALIFGCGYLGRRVAERWLHAGVQVHVVTRSEANAAVFRAAGYKAMVADVTRPHTLGNLPTVDTVLFAVGYDRSGDKSIEEVYVDGMQNVLTALPRAIARLIYISSTGVYGDASGDWVDEQTPTDPQRPGGKASLAAENLIRDSWFADRGVLLRLAGIYGPHRVPYRQQLEQGEPLEATENGYLNLIHVDDAAKVVVELSDLRHAIEGPLTYCVSDGNPVVRGEYYREVARQLGTPEPRFVAPPPNSPRAARAAADKRVSNSLLLSDLQLTLAYATYREGLAAICREL